MVIKSKFDMFNYITFVIFVSLYHKDNEKTESGFIYLEDIQLTKDSYLGLISLFSMVASSHMWYLN